MLQLEKLRNERIRLWWAFSCWSHNAWIPVWCLSIQSEETNFWPALHQPAIWKILPSCIAGILLATYSEISMLSSNEEKSKIFKHATMQLHHLFYAILYHIWMFSNNKFLLVLHEGEHKALYLTYKVLKIFKRWKWNIVDIWHQQITLINNQQVSGRFELGLQCLKGAVWWAEDSEKAHWFAIPESAATEVVGVYIVVLSLSF